MFDVTVDFPKMKVGVATRDGHVTEIRYLPLSSPAVSARNALAERAALQLEAYRRDPDSRFDLPVVIEGSPLQKAVWQAMCAIPRGKTRTYGDVAKEVGAHFPVDARAVGQAFIAIDPGALAGMDKYWERTETIVATMLQDPEVRLPGSRRFAAEKSSKQGIEIPDELLAQIEKLAQQPG